MIVFYGIAMFTRANEPVESSTHSPSHTVSLRYSFIPSPTLRPHKRSLQFKFPKYDFVCISNPPMRAT
jgi:hypothetical protein